MLEEIIKRERDFKLKYESLVSKKYKHKCLYPDCNENAILSHSISKSTLNYLSKDNHLINKKFYSANFSTNDFLNPKKINMQFKPVGINEASTFKGFCKKHDNNIFENIDNNGIFTLRDIFLQLYRTSCKVHFKNNMVAKAELEIFQKEYYTNSNFENIKSINLENIILFLNDLLTDFPELDTPFKINNTETLCLTPSSNKIPLDISIMFKKINIKYPIALESSYTMILDNDYHNSLVVILPTKNSTLISILCHKNAITQYTPFFQSEIKLLNFIESLIMCDSEFYLDPEIFNSWSKNKINTLENDIYFFNERKFLSDYEMSIFDQIRKLLLIKESKEVEYHETKKIDNIPLRLNIKERFWKLGQFINENRYKQSTQQNTGKNK